MGSIIALLLAADIPGLPAGPKSASTDDLLIYVLTTLIFILITGNIAQFAIIRNNNTTILQLTKDATVAITTQYALNTELAEAMKRASDTNVVIRDTLKDIYNKMESNTKDLLNAIDYPERGHERGHKRWGEGE